MEPFYQWPELLSRFKVDGLLTEAEQRVARFVCAAFSAESRTVAWKARAGLGEVAEEIVAAAIQERVALIILSRRKKNALARVFMPSVTETSVGARLVRFFHLTPSPCGPHRLGGYPCLERSRGAFDLIFWILKEDCPVSASAGGETLLDRRGI